VEIAPRLSSTSVAVADETLSIIAYTQTNQLRLPAVICHKMQKHRLAMEGTTMQPYFRIVNICRMMAFLNIGIFYYYSSQPKHG
jgi:hypothetical protein